MPTHVFGSAMAPRASFISSTPSLPLQDTILLAFPDTLQLAGFRAVMALDQSQAASPRKQVALKWESKPELTVSFPEDGSSVPMDNSRMRDSEHCHVLLSNVELAGSKPVSVCYVSQLPQNTEIPAFVDALLDLLASNGAKSILSPCSAIIADVAQGLVYTLSPETNHESDVDNNKTASSRPRLPAGAMISDRFAACLYALASLSTLELTLLVCPDKHITGSIGRKQAAYNTPGTNQEGTAATERLVYQLESILGIPHNSGRGATAPLVTLSKVPGQESLDEGVAELLHQPCGYQSSNAAYI